MRGIIGRDEKKTQDKEKIGEGKKQYHEIMEKKIR
jgi:hypothetical protein